MRTTLVHLLACFGISTSLLAQGTAFFYQGRLDEGAGPANGLYDMRFALYDAPSGVGLIGGPHLRTNITVANGVFVLPLDFGSSAFDGAPRWLEIDVRTNGPGTFQRLSPRQPLFPTPYAIYAGSASNVASGSVVQSLNTLKDNVTLAAGSNVTITPSGNTLTLSASGAGGSGIWSTLNNNTYYNAGFVGVGTSSPQAHLHIVNPSESITHLIESGGGINSWSRAAFRNGNGQWEVGTSRGFNADQLYFYRSGSPTIAFAIQPNGDAHLQGSMTLSRPESVSHRIQTGGGVNAWTRVEFANGNGQWSVGTSRGFNGDQFYVYREGSPNIAFAVQPNGDAFVQGAMTCRVLTITGGADIAEPFRMSSPKIPKGSVVIIDENNPGHLKLSTEAYDTRVAGIVSGANGVNPGIALHQQGLIEGGENVALSGRVYVQADASAGSIKPGDLLTTSSTPGHAMKVADHSKAQGAILGKAMSALPEGKGMVLVLVTLQ